MYWYLDSLEKVAWVLTIKSKFQIKKSNKNCAVKVERRDTNWNCENRKTKLSRRHQVLIFEGVKR